MKTKILLAILLVIGLQSYAQKVTAKKNGLVIGTKNGDSSAVLIIMNGKTIKEADMKDLSPDSIESINIIKDHSALTTYGKDARNGVILIKTKGQKGNQQSISISKSNETGKSPLFIVNGVKMSPTDAMTLKPSNIESVKILKSEQGSAVYGADAANGVVLIVTKVAEKN